MQGQFDQTDAEHSRLRDQRSQVAARLSALDGLAVFRAWTELDWADADGRAIAAEEERQRLIAGSSALAEIEQRLKDNEASSVLRRSELDTLTGDVRVQTKLIRRAKAAATPTGPSSPG